MRQSQLRMIVLLIIGLFGALACGLSAPSVPEGLEATAAVLQGTVEAAAVEAGGAAATTAAELQAADLAATASAAGAQVEAVATAVIAEGAEAVAALEAAGYDTAYLEEKFASVIANENGNISVTLREDEVNAVLLLREQAALEAGQERQIRNVRVDFQGNGTLLFLGDIEEPLVAQLVVAFRPVITAGELTFAVESASIGQTDLPAFVLDTIEATINSSLTQAVAKLPAEVIVTEALIDDNSMVISGSTSP